VTSSQKQRVQTGAIIALTCISLASIVAGILVAANGSYEGGVVAIVSGAVAGIVAIVLRDNTKEEGK
jgi:hypothetical protein